MISEDKPHETSVVTSNTNPCVKLSTISLPAFDGKSEQWLDFRNIFLVLNHNSKEISDIQKFYYLKSSLH